MLLRLLTTSVPLSLSLAAPATPAPRADAAKLFPCISRYLVTLPTFQAAATRFCNEKIRANAPDAPHAPHATNAHHRPHNKPVMPPVSQLWILSGPNGNMFKTKFEITGFGPQTREYCRQGWAIEGKWKAETLDEQVMKENVCKGAKGDMLVKGWDGGIWWNKFKVKLWNAES